ncbi:MAG: MarR family winged helix-turn-helix transcriptional regulator [Solirubrobacteraceae bacterium]
MSSPTAQRVRSPVLLLPRLAKQIFRRSSDELLGMPLKAMLALSYLQDTDPTHPGSPQQDLADALGVDANMVVLVLNEVEDRGWAQRRRDPHDRRRHRVEITTEGRAALKRTEKAQQAIEDEVLGALDPEERATLADLLGRALSGLERPGS